MGEIETEASASSREEKRGTLLKQSLIFSAVWVLIGHGYFYFSDAFSFDSLHTIAQSDAGWKISLGRFAQPLYKNYIRGNISSPWLIGIFVILFLSLSVCLIARLLKLHSGLSIFAAAGALGVNLTMILTTASYIHEADIFMLAMLLETAAVYLCRIRARGSRRLLYLLLAALCVAFSLGLYQAYISVGLTLTMLTLMNDCLEEGRKIKSILVQAARAALMFLLSGILYYCFVQISLHVTGTVLASDTNGLNNLFNYSGISFFSFLIDTYRQPLSFLFVHVTSYSPAFVIACNWILLIIMTAVGILLTVKDRRRMAALGILMVLLPLAMAAVRFLNPASYYELMIHSYSFYYIQAIMIIDAFLQKTKGRRGVRQAACAAICLVLCVTGCGARFANQVYLKKDLESKAFQSYMTEVCARMDSVDGYVPGQTEVLFLTSPQMTPIGYELNDQFDSYNGLSVNSFYASKWRFKWYMQFVMQRPDIFFEDEEAIKRFRLIDTVQNMPVFPAPGSMQIIEYVLVVNLSANAW